jgi:hypothetical protein
MRPTPRPLLRLVAVLLLTRGTTLAVAAMAAAGPVGTWIVDTTALRGELERLMRADLPEMPADQQARTEAVMPGRIDEIVHRGAGTVEFRPGGTAVLEDYEAQRRDGRWTLDGNRVRLLTAEDPPYAGTLEGDTMRLEPEGQDGPALGLVLRRR